MSSLFHNRFLQVLSLLLLVQAVLFYTASHGDARILPSPLEKFPSELPNFRRIADGVVDQETRDVLKADDVLSRFYVRSSVPEVSTLSKDQRDAAMSTAVEFFVAYFSTQRSGQSPHSPKNCLPGSGWTPVDTGEIQIPINGVEKPLIVNKYIITKGSSQSVVLYWYQSHGRVVANEFTAKFFLVTDSMRFHRSDTALLRVVTPVNHDDVAAALSTVTEFVQSAFPAAYKFLPM